jgi:2-phosphoglycerate kinase
MYLMSQPEKVEPSPENVKVEYRQAQDEEIEKHYDIWKFTRGDVIVILIGGVLGGIFSVSVIRLFGI